jgi:hypothetical protein
MLPVWIAGRVLRRVVKKDRARMPDLIYVTLTLLFFTAAVAYVAGCDRLK